jgi:hypothetical protein
LSPRTDAQETGRLLEGLLAEARHLAQRAAFGEGPVGRGKRPRRCATSELSPDTRASSAAEAVFTSTPTAFTQSSTAASSRLRQLALIDVVLVLPHTDRLRVDLDQFGQRILQPARDRHRAAQR